MIKLTKFAKQLGLNARALKDTIKKKPSAYPSLHKLPGINGSYLVNKEEAAKWIESIRVK